MEQDFGRTSLGGIRIETSALMSLVELHLPQDARCTALRLRGHDRLCLVVVTDRREFWSREDDLKRARAIVADLKTAGVESPRLRWIRQSSAFPCGIVSVLHCSPCEAALSAALAVALLCSAVCMSLRALGVTLGLSAVAALSGWMVFRVIALRGR